MSQRASRTPPQNCPRQTLTLKEDKEKLPEKLIRGEKMKKPWEEQFSEGTQVTSVSHRNGSIEVLKEEWFKDPFVPPWTIWKGMIPGKTYIQADGTILRFEQHLYKVDDERDILGEGIWTEHWSISFDFLSLVTIL